MPLFPQRKLGGCAVVASLALVPLLTASDRSGEVATAAAQPVQTTDGDRPSWWFPSRVAIGKEYQYRLSAECVLNPEAPTASWKETVHFGLRVSAPDEGHTGCKIHVIPPKSETEFDTELRAMLVTLRDRYQNGLEVTDEALLIKGQPLIRGPWRQGDRSALVILCFLFFDFAQGVVHFDVTDAAPDSASLAMEFWAGDGEPKTRGRGDISFASDDKGFVGFDAKWQWTDEDEIKRVELSMKRTGIE